MDGFVVLGVGTDVGARDRPEEDQTNRSAFNCIDHSLAALIDLQLNQRFMRLFRLAIGTDGWFNMCIPHIRLI